MELNIPVEQSADQLERARARVDQLISALRLGTDRLASDADSALIFEPASGQPE